MKTIGFGPKTDLKVKIGFGLGIYGKIAIIFEIALSTARKLIELEFPQIAGK